MTSGMIYGSINDERLPDSEAELTGLTIEMQKECPFAKAGLRSVWSGRGDRVEGC